MTEQIIYTMPDSTAETKPAAITPAPEKVSGEVPRVKGTSRSFGEPPERRTAGTNDSPRTQAAGNPGIDIDDVRQRLQAAMAGTQDGPQVAPAPFHPDAITEPIGQMPAADGGGTGRPPGEPPVPGEGPDHGGDFIPAAPVEQAASVSRETQDTVNGIYESKYTPEQREKLRAVGAEDEIKKIIAYYVETGGKVFKNEEEFQAIQERMGVPGAFQKLKTLQDENPDAAQVFEDIGMKDTIDQVGKADETDEDVTQEDADETKKAADTVMDAVKKIGSKNPEDGPDPEDVEEAKKTLLRKATSGVLRRMQKGHKGLYYLSMTALIVITLYAGALSVVAGGISGKR